MLSIFVKENVLVLKQPKPNGKVKTIVTTKANSSVESKPTKAQKTETKYKAKPTVYEILEFVKILHPVGAKQLESDLSSKKLKLNFISYFNSFDKLYVLLFMLFPPSDTISPSNVIRSQIHLDVMYHDRFKYINENYVEYMDLVERLRLKGIEPTYKCYPFDDTDPNDRILKEFYENKGRHCYHADLLNNPNKLALAFNDLAEQTSMYHSYWVKGKWLNAYVQEKGLDPKYMYIHPDNDATFVLDPKKPKYFSMRADCVPD